MQWNNQPFDANLFYTALYLFYISFFFLVNLFKPRTCQSSRAADRGSRQNQREKKGESSAQAYQDSRLHEFRLSTAQLVLRKSSAGDQSERREGEKERVSERRSEADRRRTGPQRCSFTQRCTRH